MFLKFEFGPTVDVELQWATYFDAADEAGASRRWGGIHPVADDLPGRVIGSQCGLQVWDLVPKYWDGSIIDSEMKPALARTGSTEARLEWGSVRGLFYKVERGLDGQRWTPVGPAFQATEPLSEWTDTAATGDRAFYRVLQEPAP